MAPLYMPFQLPSHSSLAQARGHSHAAEHSLSEVQGEVVSPVLPIIDALLALASHAAHAPHAPEEGLKDVEGVVEFDSRAPSAATSHAFEACLAIPVKTTR